MRIDHFDLYALDLPFKAAFKHAAAERRVSDSLLLRCVTTDGAVGWGESMPRPYVTGETRDSAYDRLARYILPDLIGRQFDGPAAVVNFLEAADGQPPPDQRLPRADAPDLAAWCAVDLALLDAVHQLAGQPVSLPALLLDTAAAEPDCVPFSAVASADPGLRAAAKLLLMRLYGFRQVKLKVGDDDVTERCRRARRFLGHACDLRVDANMAWSPDQTRHYIHELSALGIHTFEQPVPVADMPGLATLAADEPGLVILADEAAGSRDSIRHLAATQACNGVNIRISKCGGLIAARRRAHDVLAQGWTLQIGCHVGESSLLAAAQLALLDACPQTHYAEGCYGAHLLREDPFTPQLQFGRAGRRPQTPDRPGFGVQIDPECLARWTTRSSRIG